MIRIEVQVETTDPALRDYVLGDVESWRRTTANISVSTSEEDRASGGGTTLSFSSSVSMGVTSAGRYKDDEPPPPPPLAGDDVRALARWLDASADWLREQLSIAETRGHTDHGVGAANLHLYEGAALLLREAYDL